MLFPPSFIFSVFLSPIPSPFFIIGTIIVPVSLSLYLNFSAYVLLETIRRDEQYVVNTA